MDIYGKEMFPEEFEKMFEAVEETLGFKLFVWQKHYIMYGSFRQYGATTAQVLRDLMKINEPPICFSRKSRNGNYEAYKQTMKDIKRQLDEAGVPTRTVFFDRWQKEAYLRICGHGKRDGAGDYE